MSGSFAPAWFDLPMSVVYLVVGAVGLVAMLVVGAAVNWLHEYRYNMRTGGRN